LTVLDDPKLILMGKPMGLWVKPTMGMGMGQTLDTHAIPSLNLSQFRVNFILNLGQI
jgi:hypothetical protein